MENGKNLWNAVELVIRAGSEVTSMIDDLSERMNIQLQELGKELEFKVNSGSNDYEYDDDDWVCISSLLQWGLMEKKKRTKYTGNLSVSVVLWADEVHPGFDIPYVSIGYVGYSNEVSQDYCAAGSYFNPEGWKELFPGSDGSFQRLSGPVTQSQGLRWNESANWCFAIPLFQIQDKNGIDRLVIQPSIKLLRGGGSQ